MTDMADMELVRRYARDNSEEAFAALVSRHVNLVYSAALRQTGDATMAEEITQATFIILARKANSLGDKTILSGWLCRTARYVSANALTIQRRRQRREQEAYMQSILNEPANEEMWQHISPLLDNALADLAGKDHDAIVLRFFENRNLAQVGTALGVSEDAAKKRVSRALEKMRRFFFKRGVNSTTATIAETLSANSVQIAPVALAKSITAVALAKGATVSLSTATLIKGAMKLMAWTKAKTAIAATAAILIIGVTTIGVVAVNHRNAKQLETYFTTLDSTYLATAPEMVLVRPSKYFNKGNYIIVSEPAGVDQRVMRRGCDIINVLETAYGVSREQMVLPQNLPHGQFDLLLTLPQNSRSELQTTIKKQFGLIAHTESRDMDVLVLKVASTNAPGLKVSAGGGPNIWTDYGSIKLQGYKMADAAHVIGTVFDSPVVDETGLTDAYDVEARWNPRLQGAALQKEIKKVLREQFGLELTPDRRPQDMLVVERKK